GVRAVGGVDSARVWDAVEDKHGPWVADTVLVELSSLAHWYATRSDSYQPPFVRGMRRVDSRQRKRTRLLSDDEIRAIWQAAEQGGTYGAMVRMALLTGQRREKIANMRWADISSDGVWSIPRESEREKGTASSLQLPKMALAVIQAQPRFASSPCVFASARRNGPVSGFAALKADFDKKLPSMPPWVFHDLRRCSRSLMTRAGVRVDVAEVVLGHLLRGVEGVYDVYPREPEKADALRRLAALIEEIVRGEPGGNVLPIPAKKRARGGSK